jgi:hypothetical protein
MNYEEIFENVPCALFIVDQDMRVLDFNRSAFTFFRQEPDGKSTFLGNVLQCEYALSDQGGCGASDHCRECLLRDSIVKSVRREKIGKLIVRLTLMTDAGLTTEPFIVASALAHQSEDQAKVALAIVRLSDWDRPGESGSN